MDVCSKEPQPSQSKVQTPKLPKNIINSYIRRKQQARRPQLMKSNIHNQVPNLQRKVHRTAHSKHKPSHSTRTKSHQNSARRSNSHFRTLDTTPGIELARAQKPNQSRIGRATSSGASSSPAALVVGFSSSWRSPSLMAAAASPPPPLPSSPRDGTSRSRKP